MTASQCPPPAPSVKYTIPRVLTYTHTDKDCHRFGTSCRCIHTHTVSSPPGTDCTGLQGSRIQIGFSAILQSTGTAIKFLIFHLKTCPGRAMFIYTQTYVVLFYLSKCRCTREESKITLLITYYDTNGLCQFNRAAWVLAA